MAVSCLVVGAPVIAFGLATAGDLVARLGAAIELVGAAALVAHGMGVRRDRGLWTTNAAWHRVAEWSLTIAPAWFLVAVGIAAGRVLLDGATAATWNLGLVAPPLAVGWLVQVLIASWTHIVPAIGPGDFAVHARQRAILGRLATARVIALNIGVGLATVGLAGGMGPLAAVGGGFILFALLAAFATFGIAVAVGRPLRRRDPDGYAVAPSGGG